MEITKLNGALVAHNAFKVSNVIERVADLIPVQSLKNLKSLYLNGNCLKNVEKHSFKGLQSLELLDLSDNQIDMIEAYSFENHYLSILYLKNNLITRQEQFSLKGANPKLFIDLIGNNISIFSQESFLKDAEKLGIYISFRQEK